MSLGDLDCWVELQLLGEVEIEEEGDYPRLKLAENPKLRIELGLLLRLNLKGI